jgi:hypothetical protein
VTTYLVILESDKRTHMHNSFRTAGAEVLPMPGAWRRAALLALVMALGGCSYALPSIPIPDLVRDPRKLLTKEEQQQAIDELSEKKAAQQADAAKQSDKPK